ncbi:hypothetical protein [Mycolicibacterium cosmeticum]|uniref:hypothetical protein n=1 Tax=Mycolicibacterium cosmeticum TaxID=258533 RepID=UPI003204679D
MAAAERVQFVRLRNYRGRGTAWLLAFCARHHRRVPEFSWVVAPVLLTFGVVIEPMRAAQRTAVRCDPV